MCFISSRNSNLSSILYHLIMKFNCLPQLQTTKSGKEGKSKVKRVKIFWAPVSLGLWLHHLACTYTHLYIQYATSHTFWQKKLLLHEHLTYLLRVYQLLKTPVRAVPSMRWSLTTKCQDLAQTTKQFSVFTRWSVIRFLREPRMGNPIFVFLFIK